MCALDRRCREVSGKWLDAQMDHDSLLCLSHVCYDSRLSGAKIKT